MKLFKDEGGLLPRRLPYAMALLLATLTAVAFLLGTVEPWWLGVAAGLLAGLVLYVCGSLTLVPLLRELERHREMGVVAVLPHRHDQAYYRAQIGRANQEVAVTGSSASRFIEDFLDPERDNAALIDALRSRPALVVRVLVPKDDFLTPGSSDRWQQAEKTLQKAMEKFPGRVQLKRFADYARHSVVIVDGEVIAGPILQDDRSKYAPAVHVRSNSPFAEKYREFFEELWKKD